MCSTPVGRRYASGKLKGLSHEISNILTIVYRDWPNKGTWLVFDFLGGSNDIVRKAYCGFCQFVLA
jgi:hypothetical protein